MQVLATARPRRHDLTARIIDMFNDEGLIARTWLFQKGVEKGVEEGLEKGLEKGLERGLEKGLEKGAEALRTVLLDTLRARGLRLTPSQKTRVAQTHELDTLTAWTRAALTAKTAGAVFTPRAK